MQFFFPFPILCEKCVLLRYIMLIQLKNSEDWRRAINANFAKMAPLPIFQFLSYINIIYLKRTDFSHRIRIQEKIALSYIKNFEKFKFFSFGLFHIGALCSKTLNAISRVKKLIKFFNFWFFVMVLTQTMRKSCI